MKARMKLLGVGTGSWLVGYNMSMLESKPVLLGFIVTGVFAIATIALAFSLSAQISQLPEDEK